MPEIRPPSPAAVCRHQILCRSHTRTSASAPRHLRQRRHGPVRLSRFLRNRRPRSIRSQSVQRRNDQIVTKFGQPNSPRPLRSTPVGLHAGFARPGWRRPVQPLRAALLFPLVIDGGDPSASDIVNLSVAPAGNGESWPTPRSRTNTTITGYGGPITLRRRSRQPRPQRTNPDRQRHGAARNNHLHAHRHAAGTFTLAGLNTVFNFTDVSDGQPAFVIDPTGGSRHRHGQRHQPATTTSRRPAMRHQHCLFRSTGSNCRHRHGQYRKPDDQRLATATTT